MFIAVAASTRRFVFYPPPAPLCGERGVKGEKGFAGGIAGSCVRTIRRPALRRRVAAGDFAAAIRYDIPRK